MTVYLNNYKSDEYKAFEKTAEKFSADIFTILQNHHSEKPFTIEQAAEINVWFNPPIWNQISKYYAALQITAFKSKEKLQPNNALKQKIEHENLFSKYLYEFEKRISEAHKPETKKTFKNINDFDLTLFVLSKMVNFYSIKILSQNESGYIEDVKSLMNSIREAITYSFEKISPSFKNHLINAIKNDIKPLEHEKPKQRDLNKEAQLTMTTAALAGDFIKKGGNSDDIKIVSKYWYDFYCNIITNQMDSTAQQANIAGIQAMHSHLQPTKIPLVNDTPLIDLAAPLPPYVAPTQQPVVLRQEEKQAGFKLIADEIKSIKKDLLVELKEIKNPEHDVKKLIVWLEVELSSDFLWFNESIHHLESRMFMEKIRTILINIQANILLQTQSLNQTPYVKMINEVVNNIEYLKDHLEAGVIATTRKQMVIEQFVRRLQLKISDPSNPYPSEKAARMLELTKKLALEITQKVPVETYLNTLHDYLPYAKINSAHEKYTEELFQDVIARLNSIDKTNLQIMICDFITLLKERSYNAEKSNALQTLYDQLNVAINVHFENDRLELPTLVSNMYATCIALLKEYMPIAQTHSNLFSNLLKTTTTTSHYFELLFESIEKDFFEFKNNMLYQESVLNKINTQRSHYMLWKKVDRVEARLAHIKESTLPRVEVISCQEKTNLIKKVSAFSEYLMSHPFGDALKTGDMKKLATELLQVTISLPLSQLKAEYIRLLKTNEKKANRHTNGFSLGTTETGKKLNELIKYINEVSEASTIFVSNPNYLSQPKNKTVSPLETAF